MDDTVNHAREQGYVATMFGRRRYLPDIRHSNFNLRSFAERTAINTPIQGTAADIIKIAMLKVEQALSEAKVKSRILLQVHDELVLEVMETEKELVAQLVKAMESAASLSVPLTADVAWGKTGHRPNRRDIHAGVARSGAGQKTLLPHIKGKPLLKLKYIWIGWSNIHRLSNLSKSDRSYD